ncbi:HNH endonuclease [Halorubrum trueperi]|uniref:HNH endonuclease n=1 Tax=Halorubrum trueperi TaxID=2004704 RepID=A0ABD5UFA3_9EURY
MGRDADRERTWDDRAGTSCPRCGRSYDDTERADVHHRDGDDGNGSPNNLRKRCKSCHLGGEHGRDVESPKTPAGLRRRGPSGPSRSGPPR